MTKSKKIISLIIAVVLLSTLFSTSVFAAKQNFSFSVTVSNNYGSAFTAGNPKSDNEQSCYVYSTKNNLIASDEFFYNVRRSGNRSATEVLGYVRITPNMIPRFVGTYKYYSGAGTKLFLQVDVDRAYVSTEGYWYS